MNIEINLGALLILVLAFIINPIVGLVVLIFMLLVGME